MKQRITNEQIKELTDGHKEKLRELWNPALGDLMLVGFPFEGSHEYLVNAFDAQHVKSKYLPLLSIGQMIEILRTQDEFSIDTYKDKFGVSYKQEDKNYISWDKVELCDALWEAIKQVI